MIVYIIVIYKNTQYIYEYTSPNRALHVHTLAVASVIIDIERRVVNVIENQPFAEVCLVKTGTIFNTIIAVVGTDEITDNVGSPRKPILT